jgi:2-succinyl-5-enolpyruvyl-6-hydroxy-3-cyclohexene-1-carboxylate synthase
MSNIVVAESVIKELLAHGVQDFCLCAGARNSPFVKIFEKNPHLNVFHFFDERSAAFFALGRIGSSRRPVAVITTSGTAAAEMLPAAVEGTYSSLPLIMITADRPKKYRGSGAPQSIEQVGLFSYYIEVCFDLDEENHHISLKGLSWKKPVHVNVCFSEPLIDDEVSQITIPPKSPRARFPESFPMTMKDQIQDFVENHKPLVILSTLPEKVKEPVLKFLTELRAPVYVEGISNLRGVPQLEPLTLKAGEKLLPRLFDLNACNALIRIGGVPTLRFWRDLEDKRKDIPVLSMGYNHFAGLSRDIMHFLDLDDLSRIDVKYTRSLDQEFLKKDSALFSELNRLLLKYPQSEPSLVRALSFHTKGQSVYLGNSLPIREWDLAADFASTPARMVGNRGANGIDGQISTFLGWARKGMENWCLVGDLTALYDLSAPWISQQLQDTKLKIVVINNSGGMIFKRMFQHEIFLNRHQTDFKAFADLWKWNYSKWQEVPEKLDLAQRHIIEICPHEKQTQDFWDEWESLQA